VAAHGGTSEVISTPGRGTTIRIRLPLGPAAHPLGLDRTAELVDQRTVAAIRG
jgi:hypothetical protein